MAAYHTGFTLALLLDYDGTLTPIVEHPSLATLSRQTRRLLHCLAMKPRVVVGIVSGRPIDNLKAIINMPGICYAGISGLELELNGRRISDPLAELRYPVLQEAAKRLEKLAVVFPGAWVENKRLGLAFHYRNVGSECIDDLLMQTARCLRCFGDCLCTVPGPLALEIRPASEWNKGTAVRRILQYAGADAIPLYAGDEANDEDALAAAAALGGVAVGIGPRCPKSAQHQLDDPTILIHLLRRLAGALGAARNAVEARWLAFPYSATAMRGKSPASGLRNDDVGFLPIK